MSVSRRVLVVFSGLKPVFRQRRVSTHSPCLSIGRTYICTKALLFVVDYRRRRMGSPPLITQAISGEDSFVNVPATGFRLLLWDEWDRRQIVCMSWVVRNASNGLLPWLCVIHCRTFRDWTVIVVFYLSLGPLVRPTVLGLVFYYERNLSILPFWSVDWLFPNVKKS